MNSGKSNIMKRMILSLMAVLLVVSAAAQSRKQVRQYYYWVNQAELAICDSNYESANECYDKAFHIQYPFPKDLLSAYSLNLKITKDFDRIQKYAKQLVECGDYELSKRYARNGEVDTQIYSQLQYIESNYHSLCDTSLQKYFERIIQKDQSYSHSWGMSSLSEDSMNRSVMLDIETIFEKYKKINTQTAGLHYQAYLYTPAIHYIHTGNHDFQNFIKKHTLNGCICADVYMELEDEYLWWTEVTTTQDVPQDPNGYGQGQYYFNEFGGTIFITYPVDVKLVNKHRKKLGISETFEDLVKKISWEYTHNILRWHSITISHYGDEEDDDAEAAKMKREIDAEHAAGDFHRMYYEKGSKASK